MNWNCPLIGLIVEDGVPTVIGANSALRNHVTFAFRGPWLLIRWVRCGRNGTRYRPGRYPKEMIVSSGFNVRAVRMSMMLFRIL